MKKLKQALSRDSPKKTKPSQASTSSVFYGSSTQAHLGSNNRAPTYLFKSPNKSTNILKKIPEISEMGSGIEAVIVNAVERYFKKGDGADDVERVVREIVGVDASPRKDKPRLNRTVTDEELNKLQEIKELVDEILQSKEEACEKRQKLRYFHEELGKVIRNKNRITKKEKLDEYDKLIRMLSPRKNIYKHELGVGPLSMSVSLSPNIKVKVTKEEYEYEIKRDLSDEEKGGKKLTELEGQGISPRMGSQGKRVKTAGSSHSGFKSQTGKQKLRRFLSKQPSLKMIKTKVQYDYSAILEASRSKIQTRNHNLTMGLPNSNSCINVNINVNGKQTADLNITSKLNKAKKNQAFVFHRPKFGGKDVRN